MRASRRPWRGWALLTAWTGAWMVPHLWRPGVSWHFFDQGARLLFAGDAAGGGLHLYADHPRFQIGPLSFLIAEPLRLADPWHGRFVAVALMTASGPVLLWLAASLKLARAGTSSMIPQQRLTLAGLVFLPVWTELATHFAHLDDVLALTFGLLALHAVERERPLLGGILLGCAVDSKPWAAAFVCLIFVLPRHDRLRAAAAWIAAVGAAWLPFLLSDPATVRAGAFTIPNAASSALRALGVAAPRTPTWDRPLQIVLGSALGWLAVRTGRWPAALFAVIAVRLLLDPGTYAYYTSGLVLAAVLVDLLLTTRRLPVFALGAATVVYAARATPLDAQLLGQLRAAYCIVALLALYVPYRRSAAYPAHGDDVSRATPVSVPASMSGRSGALRR
jgi:hypothetical protein